MNFMKQNRYILSLLFIVIVSCQSKDNSFNHNPYNLNIIDNYEEYGKSVKSDIDNELIDLENFIPNIKLDIRYATTNNFTKKQVYLSAKAFIRKPVAESLLLVQKQLEKQGLGLMIYDAYRPYTATLKFWEILPDSNFCANPKKGSRHNRGAAIDVTLYNLQTNQPLIMPSDYDDFSKKAHPQYSNCSNEEKYNRDLLISIMQSNGFTVYQTEWWHFDYNGWEKFQLLDISFENLQVP